jgi:hypothetical protein
MKGADPIRSKIYTVISKPRSILKITRFLTAVHTCLRSDARCQKGL